MPKNIPINPIKTLSKSVLKSSGIPVHQYQKSIQEELKIYGKENLIELLRHMYIVREFETMLNSFKTKGSYKNIEYIYNGPAHLSIGQEAAVRKNQTVYLELKTFSVGIVHNTKLILEGKNYAIENISTMKRIMSSDQAKF